MIFSNLPPLATRNHAGSNHQIKPEKTEFVDDPNSSSNHKDKDEVKPKSSRQVEDIEKDIEILNRELGPPILIGGPSGILTESQFQLVIALSTSILFINCYYCCFAIHFRHFGYSYYLGYTIFLLSFLS